MDINKVCIVLIVLVASLGITCVSQSDNAVYGAGSKWIAFTTSNVGLSDLSATIRVTIKNKGNHVEYFKISNVYTGSLSSGTIQWVIAGTDPKAVKMVDSVNPQLNGDYGWKVQPGETKTVTFTLRAVGLMGIDPDTNQSIPTHIERTDAEQNTYWPLIPDPGLASSWFQPNELEMLNPNLDLKSWKGTFRFMLTNLDSERVSGIIRAPIVPTDSKLTYSKPVATFKDRDYVLNGAVAAWDVTLNGGASRWYTYSYKWPASGSSSSGSDPFKSSVFSASAASETSPVSTKDTGVPYVPFILGGILVAGGLAYAGFRR